jgi:hypothetical protein
VAAVSAASSERGAFLARVMDRLTHATIPASTVFLPGGTWAVTNFRHFGYFTLSDR